MTPATGGAEPGPGLPGRDRAHAAGGRRPSGAPAGADETRLSLTHTGPTC